MNRKIIFFLGSDQLFPLKQMFENNFIFNQLYSIIPFHNCENINNELIDNVLNNILPVIDILIFQYYPNKYGIVDCGISESVESTIINPKKHPPLFEEQKDSVAGNDRSEYVTKFKLTVNKLNEFMEDKESYIWKDLIEELDHHYSNDKSAMGALKKLIGGNGPIQGYYFDTIDKKICLIKGDKIKF